MQYKPQICLFFLIIGQLYCPKIAFSPIYIDIKVICRIKKMTEKMLKFVNVVKQTPNKRTVNKRLDDLSLNIMRDWKVALSDYLKIY